MALRALERTDCSVSTGLLSDELSCERQATPVGQERRCLCDVRVKIELDILFFLGTSNDYSSTFWDVLSSKAHGVE